MTARPSTRLLQWRRRPRTRTSWSPSSLLLSKLAVTQACCVPTRQAYALARRIATTALATARRYFEVGSQHQPNVRRRIRNLDIVDGLDRHLQQARERLPRASIARQH